MSSYTPNECTITFTKGDETYTLKGEGGFYEEREGYTNLFEPFSVAMQITVPKKKKQKRFSNNLWYRKERY